MFVGAVFYGWRNMYFWVHCVLGLSVIVVCIYCQCGLPGFVLFGCVIYCVLSAWFVVRTVFLWLGLYVFV